MLGNEKAEVSVPGEILIKKNEFYDYEGSTPRAGMGLVVPGRSPTRQRTAPAT